MKNSISKLKIAYLICFCFVISACGIKGKPTPPSEPNPLGDGRLQKVNKTKKP